MAGWTLADIQQKVRNVTGRPSTDQLSDVDLTNYINDYYVFTMPFELKEQIENQFLTFNTFAGIDVYSFPGGYFTDQPGAYADGFPLIFYQDPDIFYQDWPIQVAVNDIATGDSTTTTFTGGLQNPPIIINTTIFTYTIPNVVTSNIEVITDNGDGTMTGSLGGFGTLNYATGAYSITFASAPPSSAVIYGKYQGYSGNRPQGVLFFDNEFTFRPVPDATYMIKMQGYIKPITLTNPSDLPLQEEWGQVIAYGASLDIFIDTGDMDSYNQTYPIFKRYENVALGRTIQQLTAEQSVPRF